MSKTKVSDIRSKIGPKQTVKSHVTEKNQER